ncbi:TraR/DksA family transcriptional regulator [Desertimonas flava]|uniref:TraR/DksA family transcriptional regulator n=1 Tax=Desertimonas flava TaxID=2064846 RepID=UPI000E343210|nr:TraR/DksA C4-type zinc finger protein [Desertimonas flava]
MGAADVPDLVEIVRAAQEQTVRQIAALEAMITSIVEGSELVATDDEHDPEGATIAYERAQATALLRQARADLDALAVTRRRLEAGEPVLCRDCGRPIPSERVAALPTSSRCVACAS